ncbi:FAD-dependent oxidoreductase, partial [Patescibacteria group bacterium]|nr:FAD-dependent oxidoreductase [Patescibacteria group bacterium]
MMVKDKGEVVVIGSGPAGYVASIRAAQLGGEVILIEKDKLGGVCLNVGCIPTKTLVQSVELASLIRRAKQFGLKVENFSPDLAQIMERKRKIVNQLVRGVEYLIKKNKVNLIKGRATIADSSRVIVETEEGDYQIKAKNIIITTGSSPANLPLEKIDTEDTLTST